MTMSATESMVAVTNDETIKKRKTPPNPTGTKPVKKVKRVGPKSPVLTTDALRKLDDTKDADPKPKRVRTGCLTCRERHLKCDEAVPECNNCKKSNRQCKRGIKLNFLETTVQQPPRLVTPSFNNARSIEFLDESREIASEYQGGTERYAALDQLLETARPRSIQAMERAHPHMIQSYPLDHTNMIRQPLPPPLAVLPASQPEPMPHVSYPVNGYDEPKQDPAQFASTLPAARSTSTTRSFYNEPGTNNSSIVQGSVASYQTVDTDVDEPSGEKKEYLDTQEETLFMQVFVEEVGLWMDSMDPHKHFSRILPFHSLGEPMLLNAFLACGAKHLTLVNPSYQDERALHYYDTATHFLLRNLTNPNRDTVVCATTAVILNVYEIMSERATQRMNHIAGARALIKECGWNARAQGVGAACFWLNVGLEVLSCLHFNWQVAWNPDDWGLDMDLTREVVNGREESWTHRMLYIIAKVCNFRATAPRSRDPHSREEQMLLQQRSEQWDQLRALCQGWENHVPRTMQPMAFVYPHQTSTKSCFPEVWLIKRSTVVARLFYHTAMLLLCQTHPYMDPTNNADLAETQAMHARMICGIVAHVKDRGVASVAIRSLAHAAEVLTQRSEQEEVIDIFKRINRETGWRVGYIYGELMSKWGWEEKPSPLLFAQTHTGAAQRRQSQLQEPSQQRQAPIPAPQPHAEQQATSMQMNYGQQSMTVSPHAGMHNLPPIPAPQFHQQQQQQQQQQQLPVHLALSNPSQQQQPQQQQQQPSKPRKLPSGIVNPLFASADFNLPQHPYQNFYVAPTHDINLNNLPHHLLRHDGHMLQHHERV